MIVSYHIVFAKTLVFLEGIGCVILLPNFTGHERKEKRRGKAIQDINGLTFLFPKKKVNRMKEKLPVRDNLKLDEG